MINSIIYINKVWMKIEKTVEIVVFYIYNEVKGKAYSIFLLNLNIIGYDLSKTCIGSNK